MFVPVFFLCEAENVEGKQKDHYVQTVRSHLVPIGFHGCFPTNEVEPGETTNLSWLLGDGKALRRPSHQTSNLTSNRLKLELTVRFRALSDQRNGV